MIVDFDLEVYAYLNDRGYAEFFLYNDRTDRDMMVTDTLRDHAPDDADEIEAELPYLVADAGDHERYHVPVRLDVEGDWADGRFEIARIFWDREDITEGLSTEQFKELTGHMEQGYGN